MEYISFALVLMGSFFVGTFGFAQITGSIRCFKIRGFIASMVTIILWAAILTGVYFLIKALLPDTLYALYIGYVISFVLTLGTGRDGKVE